MSFEDQGSGVWPHSHVARWCHQAMPESMPKTILLHAYLLPLRPLCLYSIYGQLQIESIILVPWVLSVSTEDVDEDQLKAAICNDQAQRASPLPQLR